MGTTIEEMAESDHLTWYIMFKHTNFDKKKKVLKENYRENICYMFCLPKTSTPEGTQSVL